jgi:lactate racemase
MYNEVLLPYGDSILRVALPSQNSYSILSAKHVPGIVDEREALRSALRRPVDSPGLKECVPDNARVVIITTDNTRHCPDDRIVPVILEELADKVEDRNITIVIALGLHAPLTREEMITKLGRSVVENYRVINHDPCQTVFLGITSSGTPVEVNRTVVEADFRISTGFIEPHFFAGFSGGRKSIAPGVSSARAIRYNHRYDMVGNLKARAGVLEGNPVHEDMVEQAKMARLDFILNVLLNREKQITHVLAGSPWSAHAMACEIEKGIVQVELARAVDISLVTNAGAPLDLDFYQTCKGIDAASRITRPGGIIIMASGCQSGIGPEAFKSLHASCGSPAEVLDKVRLNQQEGVVWQNQILANAQLKQSVYLYSNLEDAAVEAMMVSPIHSIEEGLARAYDVLGSNASLAVIPEGPLVLPVVRSS